MSRRERYEPTDEEWKEFEREWEQKTLDANAPHYWKESEHVLHFLRSIDPKQAMPEEEAMKKWKESVRCRL